MKSILPFLFIATVVLPLAGQDGPAPENGDTNPAIAIPAPAPKSRRPPSASESQAIVNRLTKSNQELLDLLKQQQAVLEDIQYDRRLQNRQITLVEARLEDTLENNAALQVKIAQLQGQLAAGAPNPSEGSASSSSNKETSAATPPVNPTPPPPPSTYLPPEETTGASGALWWHRVTTFSGNDSKDTPAFHITGKQWRVLWHNQDLPGAAYKNTSALFINAYPKSDAIPKKICSQLGTGGDTTQLTGPGDFYLKVEASGGNWELAVEDYR